MTFWMRWLGLYAGSASCFSSKLLNCRHLLKTSAAWGWCPPVRDAGAVWTSNWFVSMETVDFRCFREVGGELSPWAWFCLSDWIGCCTAIVEQQPMKGLSISRWSQLGREARGSNLLPLWDSQGHSPPWHLKQRVLPWLLLAPKESCNTVQAAALRLLSWDGWGVSWSCTSPHLLGKSWKLFDVYKVWRKLRTFRTFKWCFLMKLLKVQFVVLLSESPSIWSAVTMGDHFETFFQKWKVISWDHRRCQSMNMDLEQVQIRRVFTKSYIFLVVSSNRPGALVQDLSAGPSEGVNQHLCISGSQTLKALTYPGSSIDWEGQLVLLDRKKADHGRLVERVMPVCVWTFPQGTPMFPTNAGWSCVTVSNGEKFWLLSFCLPLLYIGTSYIPCYVNWTGDEGQLLAEILALCFVVQPLSQLDGIILVMDLQGCIRRMQQYLCFTFRSSKNI